MLTSLMEITMAVMELLYIHLQLHCKHLAPPGLHHRRFQEICNFCELNVVGFSLVKVDWHDIFQTYMGSHEDWKNLKTASRAGTTWPCEFRNWRLGFSAQLLKTMRWILNYAKIALSGGNIWPTHVFYSFSHHNKYFLHFTQLVIHNSPINIFEILIHIYAT